MLQQSPVQEEYKKRKQLHGGWFNEVDWGKRRKNTDQEYYSTKSVKVDDQAAGINR